MALEVLFFGASPTPQLLISATVVACAVYVYNRAASLPSRGQLALSGNKHSLPLARALDPSELEVEGIDDEGAARQPLLGVSSSGHARGEETLMPMLTRGADGAYNIRTRSA